MHYESVGLREPLAIMVPSEIFSDALATVCSHEPKLFRVIVKVRGSPRPGRQDRSVG